MECLTLFALLTLMWTVNVVSGAAVWNWALGIPLGPHTLPLKLHNESSSEDFEKTIELKSRGLDDNLLTRKHRHHHGQVSYCKLSHHCARRMFCDTHYGICRRQMKDGEQCREDKHCLKNSECVFGTCRKMVKYGMIGAKCQDNSDCGANSCCARNHGEMICKSRLSLGHKCYIPNGGLDYTINEMCPCEDGLYCTYNHLQIQPETLSLIRSGSQLKSKNEAHTMRCAPFPVGSLIKIV